ncbi:MULTISPECIES: Holliday junction resolvase RuvX [unclassified Moraxella]|uniref:Holliday junction resolvase RuvX n=1 Tax=unclassified Moraxella TaxID=2685852 RepID=UPI002B400DFE|nr:MULTISPECIES: Holliday junction resolvase RuvX [unclassified Moraxella]
MIDSTQPKLILALDFGIKKMGMALGNSLTMDARPFDILAMNNGQPDWDNLLGIIEAWKINEILVGLPINMDGTDSMLSKRAAKFARRLSHRLGERHSLARVFMYDERLSSRQAQDLAWERGWISSEYEPIDDIAACILIDGYFNAPTLAQYVSSYHDKEHKGKD